VPSTASTTNSSKNGSVTLRPHLCIMIQAGSVRGHAPAAAPALALPRWLLLLCLRCAMQ
jgi:hypothetical protein